MGCRFGEPFLGKLGAAGQIDSQNRITGTVYYVSGYKLYQWGAPPGYTYTSYVSRWPASTAASVRPSKLISQSDNFGHQSPDGSNGAVVGKVGVVGSALSARAAIWRESGAFEVLNTEPDTSSSPLGVTDSGDVLVWITKANPPEQSYALISHGVAKTIAAPNPGERLSPTAINANGVVVGTINQPSAPEGFRDRGFIWKDGVLTDLTAWVTAKGLKLPVGTVIAGPWQINAQGSILATMRDANGKTTMVRLTAKP